MIFFSKIQKRIHTIKMLFHEVKLLIHEKKGKGSKLNFKLQL